MNNQALQGFPKKIKLPQLSFFLVLTCFYLPVVYLLGKLLLTEQLAAKATSFIFSKLFLNTLIFSVKQAFLSACFSIILAFPAAYFFGRFQFPGKQLIRSMLVIPFMMPGILLVLGLVVFYGNNGLFNNLIQQMLGIDWRFSGLYGFWGIVLAHVVYDFPLCIRILGESWERINPSLLEASRNLGANPFNTWCRITLPLLFPTVAYLLMIVFIYSFLSFTVVLVFGGYLYKTFEVLIYIEYNHKLRFENALLIAGIQSIILLIFLYLQVFFNQKRQHQSRLSLELPRLRLKENPIKTIFFILYGIGGIFFLASPFVTIILRSFLEDAQMGRRWVLENYRQLFGEAFRFSVGTDLWNVLFNSILLALLVAVISVSFAYMIARWRRHQSMGIKDLWLQLPLGISFMAFSFGLLNITGQQVNGLFLICWGQVFLAFPLVYSILRTAFRDIPETLLENATLLGASHRQLLLTIELPLLKKALSSAFAYAMAISIGDLAAVLVLGKGTYITISMAIYRLIGHYHFKLATALGGVFIFISVLLFLIVENNILNPFLKTDGEPDAK